MAAAANFPTDDYILSFSIIWIQEKATKWQDNVEIDGLTTNGVLIMHPKGQFCGGFAGTGVWRECSVGGDVFSLRESRSAQQKGQPVRVCVQAQISFGFFWIYFANEIYHIVWS